MTWETSNLPDVPPRDWLEDSLAHCGAGIAASDRARYNAAFFLLALCRREEGLEEFTAIRDSRLIGAEARAALSALGAEAWPADSKPVGLLALLNEAELPLGRQSIVDAAFGRHCVENGQGDAPGVPHVP